MRSLLLIVAMLCLSLVAGMASAASPGNVPDATLALFGLSGMQQMTDAQGSNVRGTGFAFVSGYVVATAPNGQISARNYSVTSPPYFGSAQVNVTGGIAFGAASAYAK
jgi:hypothetical protein